MTIEQPPYPTPRGASDAAFIGVGEVESGKFPNRGFMAQLIEAAARAINDAGIAHTDIDHIILIPCLHDVADQADLIFSRVAEELGLHGRVKSSMMIHSGGSTSDNATRAAAGLIASGQARNVLVVQSEKWGSADLTAMVDMLSVNGIPREWEGTCGLQFNAIGGLITRRYMHLSGSTPEDMASVCVTLREWARLNPNAMWRDRDLTIEQVLASKLVADPLRAIECPYLADGAAAYVMTSATQAAQTGDAWVRIAGSGGCVSHYSAGQDADLGVLGWPTAAVEAYDSAGWGPDDTDLAEVYDSYAAVLAIALEGLGISKSGEAAREFRAGRFSPGGALPLNTNGGLLSAGHTGVGGGMALLVEGIRQLLHRAGDARQVPDARRCIVGGTGGSYMDAQIMMLERATR
jgi:acetyl-CoA C-acetyltransferase